MRRFAPEQEVASGVAPARRRSASGLVPISSRRAGTIYTPYIHHIYERGRICGRGKLVPISSRRAGTIYIREAIYTRPYIQHGDSFIWMRLPRPRLVPPCRYHIYHIYVMGHISETKCNIYERGHIYETMHTRRERSLSRVYDQGNFVPVSSCRASTISTPYLRD